MLDPAKATSAERLTELATTMPGARAQLSSQLARLLDATAAAGDGDALLYRAWLEAV